MIEGFAFAQEKSMSSTVPGKDSGQGKELIKSGIIVDKNSPETVLLQVGELSFLPQKVSQKDILIVIRKNNESANKLNYSVTAGSKTITGQFKGTKLEQKAYINLVDELKDEPALDKITLVITNLSGITLVTADIPLIEID